MKAMILAAGRGTRLKPLTDTTPKPLIKVNGKALIEYHIENLRDSNINEIIINTSHLGEKIHDHLGDGQQYGVTIHYSVETQALETGGGVYKALPLLGHKPFILISSDIWTDYPFSKLPKNIDTLAHLVMVDNPLYYPTGDFHLENELLSISGDPLLTYGNIGIYSPKLFDFRHTEKKFTLSSLLFPAIQKGLMSGEYYHGRWFNVGTHNILNCVNNYYNNA